MLVWIYVALIKVKLVDDDMQQGCYQVSPQTVSETASGLYDTSGHSTPFHARAKALRSGPDLAFCG
jgi:hypothetical protein